MMGTTQGESAPSRWGEPLLAVAALPGALAATTLTTLLIFGKMDWDREPGILANVVAFLTVSSPLLILIGMVTLVTAALAMPFVPGRRGRKLVVMALGVVFWGAAFYWLLVPGLIELP
jgi:hypothetical protein